MSRLVLVAACAWLGGCAPTLQQQREAAAPAVLALQRGAFDEAEREAAREVRADGANPFAQAVQALTAYKRAMHQLALDLRTSVLGAVMARGVNLRYLEQALTGAEADLARVEAGLGAAARPGISLELCLACWEVDWNGSGRVDEFDRRLFEIELDSEGERLPREDPRRRPTFRFDEGDVAWARAFVSFQRALLDLGLAYDWSALNGLLARGGRKDRARILVFPLLRPERVAQARARLLAGLAFSEDSRQQYLRETDDDREWVPNPRQKDHAVPLTVDDALYATWQAVVADLGRLVRGEEGLRLSEVARLFDQKDQPNEPVLDVGGMLAHPRDLVIDPKQLESVERGGVVAAVFGAEYLRAMPVSPLPARLHRMKAEVERKEESLERKLRYLFWVN